MGKILGLEAPKYLEILTGLEEGKNIGLRALVIIENYKKYFFYFIFTNNSML
jgi:hypothetical protein